MSGPIEVGQVWRHETGEGLVRVIGASEESVLFLGVGEECCELEPDDFRRYYYPEPGPTKPTIKLRIRVGVSSSGEWSAVGGSMRVLGSYAYGADTSIRDDLANVSEEDVAAWHWITAEVPMPMPELERGEVAGEVER